MDGQKQPRFCVTFLRVAALLALHGGAAVLAVLVILCVPHTRGLRCGVVICVQPA